MNNVSGRHLETSRKRAAAVHIAESDSSGVLNGAILNSVADGVFTVDRQMRITSFNRAAEELTGFSRDETIGRRCHEIFRSDGCTSSCPVREAQKTNSPVVNREFEILNKDNRTVPVSVSASVLRDGQGHPIGGVKAFRESSASGTQRRQMAEKYTFRNLVSRNAVMHRIFEALPDIARSDATVLVSGESGTGKELIIKAIHELSHRSCGPLVVVNCGALPESLLEAEFFGTRRGPYSGGGENRPGRLEMADGGTLFLDEIGELPTSFQVKLLRVLEHQEYQPLGAKNPQRVNVRFVTATNCDLNARVNSGTFRRDLFFRINVVALQIPPLRQRPEDIPLLIDVFLERLNRTYGKKIQGISPRAAQTLYQHDFPGNVRELLNIMEQAVILCRSSEIDIEHLPDVFSMPDVSNHAPARGRRKSISAEDLNELLHQHGGNRTEVAGILGVDRTTLWRWMKRHDLF
jgi:two-component system, NtrC family, response regulator HydG